MCDRRFHVHTRWVYLCVCILIGFCVIFYLRKVQLSEHQILLKQFNEETKILSILNITCQEPNRPTQDCESLLKLVSRFPRILVLGFGKAGTRALLNFLLMHPSIQGPPVEVNYFDKFYKTEGLQSYLETFPPKKLNKTNIEKSPRYIITPEVPIRLISTLKALSIAQETLKLIVVVRDPITRGISEYVEWNLQRIRENNEQLPSFDEMVLNSKTRPPVFISTSEYDTHISNWLQYFPLKQFCFVDGDLFIKNPFLVLEELEKCLGIPRYFKNNNFVYNSKKGFYCYSQHSSVQCLGKSKGRTHPEIKAQTREFLIEHFKSHNINLNKLTGRKYTWMESVRR